MRGIPAEIFLGTVDHIFFLKNNGINHCSADRAVIRQIIISIVTAILFTCTSHCASHMLSGSTQFCLAMKVQQGEGDTWSPGALKIREGVRG